MNRILVGYDGSQDADQAVALVAAMPWDAETEIHLVTAVASTRELRAVWGPLAMSDSGDLALEVKTQADATLADACDRLSPVGLTVRCTVVTGRPPQALAEEARRRVATLMVVGSRGLGTIASTVLGSVSAEIVDLAPCPVLVARSAAVRSIIFATDGSSNAEEAEAFLSSLPIAREVPVRVISVAAMHYLWTTGVPPILATRPSRRRREQEAELRRIHDEIAASSCTRLTSRGIDAHPEVRVGDPAAEVLKIAAAAQADLIVLGSRGQTGLKRLLLGSVARRVLHNAAASVLIVRSGAGVGDKDQVAKCS